MAKRSPPIPFIMGSTTPIIAFVAMAASTALPPLSRIRTPASEASGDSEATMPPLATTIDRACVLSWASDGTKAATRHAVTPVTARSPRFTYGHPLGPAPLSGPDVYRQFDRDNIPASPPIGNFPFLPRLFTLAFGRHPIPRRKPSLLASESPVLYPENPKPI